MSIRDSFEVEVDDGEKGLHKLNLEYKNPPPKKKMISFWEKYGEKIILAVGIILIAGISFQSGFLKGQKNQKEPVVVNQPACAPCPDKITNKDQIKSDSEINSASSQTKDKKTTTSAVENPARIASQSDADGQKCAYVASKNSNKYHLATCQWAEKIKPENKICFSSAEEAQSRGYQGAKCCIK